MGTTSVRGPQGHTESTLPWCWCQFEILSEGEAELAESLCLGSAAALWWVRAMVGTCCLRLALGVPQTFFIKIGLKCPQPFFPPNHHPS